MFRFHKKLTLRNLMFFNYKVRKYLVNKHNWNLELVQKIYFAHSKQNSRRKSFQSFFKSIQQDLLSI